MKKKGYATGAVISLAVLNRDFGLAKGFDHYLENFKPGLWYRTAAEVNRDAFALVDKLKNGRSFIWLHYSDPHEPYFPPGDKARFTVFQGADVLYSGPSIEQPVLRLPLLLQVGETVIGLETEPPALSAQTGPSPASASPTCRSSRWMRARTSPWSHRPICRGAANATGWSRSTRNRPAPP